MRFYRHYAWILNQSLDNPDNASLVSTTIYIWLFGPILLFSALLIGAISALSHFQIGLNSDSMLLMALILAPVGFFGISKIRRWNSHINWRQNLDTPKANEKLAEVQAKLKAITDD
ncbi:MAG: hypothetical protein JKY31_14100 [Rhodobacteraceae bacterium]|nr:hypothetical protein [Paracoccaceae bacterium]